MRDVSLESLLGARLSGCVRWLAAQTLAGSGAGCLSSHPSVASTDPAENCRDNPDDVLLKLSPASARISFGDLKFSSSSSVLLLSAASEQ